MKKYLYLAAYYFGIVSLFYWINKGRQVILVYHNVISDDFFSDVEDFGLSIRESDFRNQLDIVQKRFPITTDVGKENTCMLTFDDGYLNFFSTVCPILGAQGIKAYFFIPLSVMLNGRILWVDKIILWLSRVPEMCFEVFGRRFCITDENSRRLCKGHILSSIQRNYHLKGNIVETLDAIYPYANIEIAENVFKSRYATVSSGQIEVMKRQGHFIGCHSFQHDILGRLNDEELDADFRKCAGQVGKIYNTAMFCYPFGTPREVSRRVIEACEKAGFTAACLNQDTFRGRSIFELERTNISLATSRSEIEAHLSGFVSFLKQVKRILYRDPNSLGLFDRRSGARHIHLKF